VSGFLSTLAEEMGARRRRLRATLGDRGQAVAEFLVLGGLAMGSIGLFLLPWMGANALWGLLLPAVFLIGFFGIEWRRQGALKNGVEPARASSGADWIVFLWSFGCALAGAALLVIAWGAKPVAAPVDQGWQPPEGSVGATMVPQSSDNP
jgi:hypothetical protein